MKKVFTQTMLATAIAVGSAGFITTASAETELVIVSWGGAYTKSQQGAYHDPYMAANPDIKIINDDSAAEGAAKLRAQVYVLLVFGLHC